MDDRIYYIGYPEDKPRRRYKKYFEWIAIKIFQLFLFAGFVYFLYQASPYYYTAKNTLVVQGIPMDYKAPAINFNEDNLTKIQKIATAVSETNEYIPDQFDCTEYSTLLRMKLREQGFDAYCVTGYYHSPIYENAGSGLHTWVEVNDDEKIISVEATNGEIISPEQLKNYDLFRKNSCE